eukprot:6363753-Prymnesium_polylepis.1
MEHEVRLRRVHRNPRRKVATGRGHGVFVRRLDANAAEVAHGERGGGLWVAGAKDTLPEEWRVGVLHEGHHVDEVVAADVRPLLEADARRPRRVRVPEVGPLNGEHR